MGASGHLEQVIHSENVLSGIRPRGVLAWDTRVKLLLLAVAIVGNTWLAWPWLSGLLLLIGIGMLLWTRLPWSLQRAFWLAPLVTTAIVMLGMSIGFGVTPMLHAGPVTFYREGLLNGAYVMLRVYCDVAWLLACVVSSPFPRVLGALRWFRVPGILVDTLAMMYRYVFVLYAEFLRMRSAARARGGFAGYRTEMTTLSRIAGQLLIRAFDRSERIYWAMAARGGEHYD